MSKPRKKGGKVNAKGRNANEQYLKLPYAMARSDVFRSLGGAAVKVWFELRTRYNGGNNGSIHFGMQAAATRLGMGKSTVKRALDELEEKGFIKRTNTGTWYHGKASEYMVTDCPYKGKPATHKWRETDRELAVKKQNAGPPETRFDASTGSVLEH